MISASCTGGYMHPLEEVKGFGQGEDDHGCFMHGNKDGRNNNTSHPVDASCLKAWPKLCSEMNHSTS